MDFLLIGSKIGTNVSAHNFSTFVYNGPFLQNSPTSPHELMAGYSCPVLGNNGRIYVKMWNDSEHTSINSYDRNSGHFISTVIKKSGMGGSNFLINSEGYILAFDTDGNVNKFHPDSGSFIDVYIKNTYLEKTSGPYTSVVPLTMRLQSDKYFLISVIYGGIGTDTQAILRFDQRTGKFIDELIPKTDPHYNFSFDFVVGHNHDIFATNFNSGKILRWDNSTGSFKGIFASDVNLSNPYSLVFGPDNHLYISAHYHNRIYKFSGLGGSASLASFLVPPIYQNPTFMLFVDNPLIIPIS